jgi:RimJ/RimL family protein N-acetyltransferase
VVSGFEGWRLARNYWGRGHATEGAQASLADGFGRLGLEEIVAYTVALNAPSRRVMERIGMTHDPADDFDHKDRKAERSSAPLCRLSQEKGRTMATARSRHS